MAGPSHGNPFSRRRRQNAFDGCVPGTSPPRFHRGAHFAGTPSPADLTARMVRVDLPHPSKEYDPIHPEYPEAPGYEPPEEQDLFPPVHRTPPLRLDWPERPPPDAPNYRQTLFFALRFEELIQQVRDLRDAGEPVPENLAAFYESAMGPWQSSFEPTVTDSAPAIGTMGSIPNIVADPIPDAAIEALALQMTGIPVEEMVADHLQQVSDLGPDPAMPGLSAGPMEMSLSGMAEAGMPMADPPSLLDAPMMDLPDPIGDSPAMTLDALVEQMMPEPAPPPEMPDPYMLMQQQFNQQMQMMDPFNMMGPMM